MMRVLLIPALLLPLTAATGRDSEAPAATPSGEPVSCIPLTRIRSTRIHNDRVIDFHVGGGKVYRNTLPHDCPGLGFEERYLHKTSMNEICSHDTITVLQGGSALTPGATCGLGKFQPVTIEKAK